jgi:hypothetical protein
MKVVKTKRQDQPIWLIRNGESESQNEHKTGDEGYGQVN